MDKYSSYYIFDSPIPYRNINIHPIKLKDYVLFNTFAECLTVEKNIIPDVKIISMTELEYLFHVTEEDTKNKPYVFYLDRILAMTLADDPSFSNPEESLKRYGYDDKKKPVFSIGGEVFTSKDYEAIREIICNQNLIDLPDYTISKEVRDSMEEAIRFKRRMSGQKTASFEDHIVSLAVATGWDYEYIYGLTIRKFLKSIKRMDNLIHYKIYLASSMSGFVEYKDTSFIKHWLSEIEDEDKYSAVKVSMEEIQGKVSMESAKKKIK